MITASADGMSYHLGGGVMCLLLLPILNELHMAGEEMLLKLSFRKEGQRADCAGEYGSQLTHMFARHVLL